VVKLILLCNRVTIARDAYHSFYFKLWNEMYVICTNTTNVVYRKALNDLLMCRKSLNESYPIGCEKLPMY